MQKAQQENLKNTIKAQSGKMQQKITNERGIRP